MGALSSLGACGGNASPPAAAGATSPASGESPSPSPDAGSETAPPSDAPPPATPPTSDPVVTTPETGASGVASVSTGSDVPDECSKSALPYEEKVRPLLNKCYQEGKKKNPDLSGTVRVAVNVNLTGKVISVKPTGTSELGDSVVQCMVKAVRDTRFDGALCKSKTVVVSKTYGKK